MHRPAHFATAVHLAALAHHYRRVWEEVAAVPPAPALSMGELLAGHAEAVSVPLKILGRPDVSIADMA
jgi:hypothetical protein